MPVGGYNFCARPEQPRGPPYLLYKGYLIFPGGKAEMAWCWSSTLFWCRGCERVDPVLCLHRHAFPLYHNIDQIYQCVLSDSSTTMSCFVELLHPCAVRICLMMVNVPLLRRDAFLILVSYLTLGIHKTVSLNVFNLDNNEEDYVEMIPILKYLSPYMVL